MSELPYKVGDKVNFVPGPEFAKSLTAQGLPAYAWRHKDNRQPTRDHPGHRVSDKVDLLRAGVFRREGNEIVTGGGYPVEPHYPEWFWPAWITAIGSDGSVSLDVIDPISYRHPNDRHAIEQQQTVAARHGIPDWQAHPNAPGVKYDPTGKKPHTFHLLTD